MSGKIMAASWLGCPLTRPAALYVSVHMCVCVCQPLWRGNISKGAWCRPPTVLSRWNVKGQGPDVVVGVGGRGFVAVATVASCGLRWWTQGFQLRHQSQQNSLDATRVQRHRLNTFSHFHFQWAVYLFSHRKMSLIHFSSLFNFQRSLLP